MNKENIKKSAIYEHISKATGMSVGSVKVCFSKKSLDVLDAGQVENFIYVKNGRKQLEGGGVYAIVNKRNNFSYIGSSKNFYSRMGSHFSALFNGKHSNKSLQKDFETFGKENFEFIVLQKIFSEKKEDLFEAEMKFIKNSKNLYNIEGNLEGYGNAINFQINCNKFKKEVCNFLVANGYVSKDGEVLK